MLISKASLVVARGRMVHPQLAVHRTILVVDVEGFGDARRTSPHQVAVRRGLYHALSEAFNRTGIQWRDCHTEDRGDGVFILAPAEVPKALFVESLPRTLAETLREYNSTHAAPEQIRLRMALHAGEVHYDDHGVTSASINLAFRLLDAAPLKAALAESAGALALVTSSWFFDEVVRHAPVSNPAAYRPVRVAVKETDTTAWIVLPDRPDPPSQQPAGSTRPATGVVNELSGVVAGTVVQARDIQGSVHVHRPEGSRVAIPQQLPANIPSFIGREPYLAELDALLDDVYANRPDTNVIVTISGMPGVGKTALAVHWAHRTRERFPDGQLFVDLGGFGPGDGPMTTAAAVHVFLDALGVDPASIPTDLGAQMGLYRSLLAGKRMLIILDNAGGPEQVRMLLPASPSCLVIVTSRNRLSSLVAVNGAQELNLDLLSPDEAITLLRSEIGHDRIDKEFNAATELVQLLGYLPVAVRIAAGIVTHSVLGLGALVDKLADPGGSLDALDGNGSIRSVLSWSYQALSADTARAFRLLSMHPGADISDRAAGALLGTSPAQTRRLLDNLTRSHLLLQGAPRRWHFHDILRNYAAEYVLAEDNDSDRRAAVRRVLAWYLRTADAATRVLAPQRPRHALSLADAVQEPLAFGAHDEALQWCETERANLVSAVQLASEIGEHDIAWQLAVILWDFFNLRKYWGDWITTGRIGVVSAQRIGDRYGEAAVLHSLGNAYYDLRRFDDAIDFYRRAFTIRHEINDRHGESWTLNNLGTAYQELHRLDAAIEHYQRALIIRRDIGDRWGEGWTLNNLGEAHQYLKQFDTALGYYQQALDNFDQIGDRYGEGFTLDNLGRVYGARSQFEEAVYSYQRALVIRREIGDRWGEGWTLNNLGTAYRDLGQLDEAIDQYEQALVIRREIGDRYGEAVTLDNLGTALHQARSDDRARSCWQASRTILEDIESAKESGTLWRTRRQARVWCVNDVPIQVGRSAQVAFAVIAPHVTPDESPDSFLPYPIKLRVLLHSEQATVHPVTQIVILDVDRTTDPILFEVVPAEAGLITLAFRVYLDRDGQLLQEIHAELPVTQAGQEVTAS